jgi:hypothetical protein
MSRFRLSDVLELPVSERLKLVWAIWDSIAEAPETLQLTEDERASWIGGYVTMRRIRTTARPGLK